MRRTLAIAALTIRASIRSRLVGVLLALLAAAVIGIPLTVRGDGTPEGHVRLLIEYTLNAAAALLGLAALWSGALGIAQEIDTKQMHLLASKPVRRGQIWLGKWLGVSAMCVALLALSGAAAWLGLRVSIDRQDWTAAQKEALARDVMTARIAIAPVPPDVEADARRIAAERARAPEMAGVPPPALLQAARQERLTRANTVPPGGRVDWVFPIPRRRHPGDDFAIRYRFDASRLGVDAVALAWRVGDGPAAFRAARTNTVGVFHELRVPASALQPGAPLRVSVVNADARAISVSFAPADGVRAFIPGGGFLPNYLRGLALASIRLMLLAAIGVTMGALFSTPVAVFVALAVALLVQFAAHIATLTAQPYVTPWGAAGTPVATATDRAFRLFFRGMHAVILPLRGADPFDSVATGIRIAPGAVARAAAIECGGYALLLGLLATAAFNRREVALPS